jgi:hypothetical protein
MSIYRVRVTLSGASVVGGGLSTFYFNNLGGTAQQAVTALGTFYNTIRAKIHNTVVMTSEADVAALDPATGNLLSITGTTPFTHTGAGGGEVMSLQTQGLLRLRTDTIANNRFVHGRFFIPGPEEANNTNGAPLGAYKDTMSGAGAALVADGTCTWVVWSRTHGVEAPIVSATCWEKWASLNGRRD